MRALAAELGLRGQHRREGLPRLETDGVIPTEGRRGTFVSGANFSGNVPYPAVDTAYVATASRRLDLTLSEAILLVEQSLASFSRPQWTE